MVINNNAPSTNWRSNFGPPLRLFNRIEFTLVGYEYKCIEEILLWSRLQTALIEMHVYLDRCAFPRDGGKLISSAIGRSPL
mmetsp:Transcript_12153/g.22099  ORF Transcript_12153/g.22099 Transcript_12153/m.22099 type:complete len:81 (-) Transcript_12153:689-931(-)